MLGLVFATFLGGAVRTLLGSDRLHDRIVGELKSRFPQHEFQVGATEVLLARGLWPALSLRVHDVVFKQDVCGKLSFVLTLPETTLPLDVLSLRHAIVRLGHVDVRGGELHLDYRACPPKPVAADAVPAAAGGDGGGGAAITPPKLEWEKVARVLDGLDIHDLTITYEKSPTWKLLVKNAVVRLGDDMNARAAAELQKGLPFGELTHPVGLTLHADRESMQWNVSTSVKEGGVRLSGAIDMDTQVGRATVDLRQVPVKDFMSEMFQMGFVEHDLKLKAMWLSCHLRWEGSLKNYALAPVLLRECRAEGGYGRAELAQAEFWLGRGEYFKEPARVRVMQLQLQAVMEAVNRQVLPAVISPLGEWTGELRFRTPSDWLVDGELANAEIVFANQSLRGKQLVERVHTHAHRKGEGIEAKIDDVKLREGEFAGAIDGDLSSDWRAGSFRVRVDRLLLAPAIQRLLVGGTLAPLKVDGQGKLVDGELSAWNGTFAMAQMEGEGLSAQGLELRTTYRAGSFALDGSVRQVTVNGSWAVYPQLRTVLAALPANVVWHDVNGRFEIQKTGGTVHTLTAVQDGLTWRSKGQWIRDGAFDGSLTLFGASKRPRTFTLRGEQGHLTVQ